jgi:hypothetical protein
VRDPYSASGQPQPADGGAAAQPLDIRNTANLTQELSQLLAASIAQGQAGKRAAGGTAATAGSELANLAALVSASQSQRNSQPTYRDGLSSLSYARPAAIPPAPPPPAPVPAPPAPALTSTGLLVSEPHDEEPMPIPSTWRQPTGGEDERWYRQQMGAAALGLVAGLIVVVPAVLWLSGWIGGSPSKAVVARHQPIPEVPAVKVEVKPVKVQPVAAAAEPRIIVAPPAAAEAAPPVARTRSLAEPPAAPVAAPQPAAEPPRVAVMAPRPDPVRARADELMAQARRLIENGDISRARTVLDAPETSASGPLMFLLAETYDPNMLASWQTRGITANPERARALYQKARDLGDGRAQQRLDWLMGN